MKIGEALTLRSDIQTRIHQLKGRLTTSAKMQEGQRPPEDPEALLKEFEALLDEWTELVQRINRTNLATRLPDGTSLTDALAHRDALTARHQTLRTVADTAGERNDRFRSAEIRMLPALDVAALRQRVTEVARERRELDVMIQEVNWNTELLD